jgi:hypothetical protein
VKNGRNGNNDSGIREMMNAKEVSWSKPGRDNVLFLRQRDSGNDERKRGTVGRSREEIITSFPATQT